MLYVILFFSGICAIISTFNYYHSKQLNFVQRRRKLIIAIISLTLILIRNIGIYLYENSIYYNEVQTGELELIKSDVPSNENIYVWRSSSNDRDMYYAYILTDEGISFFHEEKNNVKIYVDSKNPPYIEEYFKYEESKIPKTVLKFLIARTTKKNKYYKVYLPKDVTEFDNFKSRKN